MNQTAGSFFNAGVGVLKFNYAPTQTKGRVALCFHCGAQVLRGSPRFTYAYHVQRPEKFMRDKCLLPFVKAKDVEARRSQAVAFCERFQGNPDASEELQALCSQILLQLLELDC